MLIATYSFAQGFFRVADFLLASWSPRGVTERDLDVLRLPVPQKSSERVLVEEGRGFFAKSTGSSAEETATTIFKALQESNQGFSGRPDAKSNKFV